MDGLQQQLKVLEHQRDAVQAGESSTRQLDALLWLFFVVVRYLRKAQHSAGRLNLTVRHL